MGKKSGPNKRDANNRLKDLWCDCYFKEDKYEDLLVTTQHMNTVIHIIKNRNSKDNWDNERVWEDL